MQRRSRRQVLGAGDLPLRASSLSFRAVSQSEARTALLAQARRRGTDECLHDSQAVILSTVAFGPSEKSSPGL